jgi:hypothetical protein
MRRFWAPFVVTLVLTQSLAFTAVRGAAVKPPASSSTLRSESALMLLTIPWQELGYEIVFMPPQIGYRAMTFPSKHRIEIYARPQDDLEQLAFDIAHELGHVIDVTYNTAETRKRWMELRGIDPSTAWFGCDRCSDYKTPAGDFAETFAMVLFGPKYFRGRIAPKPTVADITKLSAFFPKDLVPFISVIGD